MNINTLSVGAFSSFADFEFSFLFEYNNFCFVLFI